MKGKEKIYNITAGGIDAINVCAEKWKTHKEALYNNFHLVWEKVKNI